MLLVWFALLGGTSLVGQSAPSRMDVLEDERALEIGDRVVYQVVEEREPSVGLFVNDRGEIDVPLIGGVSAAGLTPRAFALTVQAELEETFFHQATVLVDFQFPTGSRGTINLAGEVLRPGSVPLPVDEILSLAEAIQRAGGARPNADLSAIRIVRTTDGEEREIVADLTALFEEGDLQADVPLEPGDVVVIPQSEALTGTYFVQGEVNSPGMYDLMVDGDPTTLSEAILRAGGFRPFARSDRVIVIREDTTLPEEERRLTVDVDAILEDGERDLDVTLAPGDRVRVNERILSWR